MSYYHHTGTALFRVVAASVDIDLLQRRWRLTLRMCAVHAEIAAERQRADDAVIVAKREERVAHIRVRALVERKP